MKTFKILCAALLAAAIFGLACSSHKKSTNPAQTVVAMQGGVTLPQGSLLSNTDLSIGFGAYDSTVDAAGDFRIEGNEHVPGLAIATVSSGAPVLMAIVPSPARDLNFAVNVHTTAVALVFLQPYICTNNPEFINGVLSDIERLPELSAVEYAIEAALTGQTLTLDFQNEELAGAVDAAVVAYIEGFSTTARSGLANALPSVAGRQVDGIEIDPNYQVGGLQLRWKGGNEFELTNTLGRWAYCTTPSDTFWVFPNGDFLDILKATRPWAPTTRTFQMRVPPNTDPQEVHVYGYGFAKTAGNEWDSLSHTEKNFAHAGGIPTVLIELCSPMVSVVTNTSVTLGREEIAKRIGGTVLGLIMSQGTLMQSLGLYAKENDPWGLSWTLAKWVMNEIGTNTEFRMAFLSATGMGLTSEALIKLTNWLAVPVKVTMTFNSVTSVMKTAMGFSNAEFNTTFEVWQSTLETGSVRGQVADSISGAPISGATVELFGDDSNPLKPAHRVTTGTEGTYYFSNITTGPKTVTASKAGYAAKTVNVTIEKDHEITADIPLARQSGGLTGKILNGVLVHYSIQPANFTKEIQIEARPAAGGSSAYLNVSNGTYAWTLAAGSWWVKAEYDGYHADSFQVTVPSSGSIAAPRDLVLQPAPTMSGNILLDMNNDGTYDQTIPITFPNVGINAPYAFPCDVGSKQYAMAMGVRGTSSASYDALNIGFNMSSITGAEAVPVGPFQNFPCASTSGRTVAFFSTTRQRCTAPEGSYPQSFAFMGDPEKPGCSCGITNPGTVFLTGWGTQLGDLITGGITADLHGWTGCYCDAHDTNGDGINDQYDVSCARAHIVVDFKIPVGTDYLIPWAPSAPGVPTSGGAAVH